MSKQSNQSKKSISQILERILYMLAVMLTPSFPLFYFYNQNIINNELEFSHFLLFGGFLAAVSLILYFLISKFFLRRRRAMFVLALLWVFFWFFPPIFDLSRNTALGLSQTGFAAFLLFVVVGIAVFLRYIRVDRGVANIIAIVLCALFVYNFSPGAFSILTTEWQRARVELPYEQKEYFYVDPDLPRPNIYWLHMDGMMGFSGVEHFFGEVQQELIDDLTARGFVINKTALFGAPNTRMALPALLSPTFYDTFYGDVFASADALKLPRNTRVRHFTTAMEAKGFHIRDTYPGIELPTAMSDAGYLVVTCGIPTLNNVNGIDMTIAGYNVVPDIATTREATVMFEKLVDFKDLIAAASILTIIQPILDRLVEALEPIASEYLLPEYPEIVDMYMPDGVIDRYGWIARLIRSTKYATTLNDPIFYYSNNSTAHVSKIDGYEVGGVTYDFFVGRMFPLDENGNFYREPLDDPHDVQLYYPQHRFATKTMLAQIDIILDNDPGAVIVIQADHGIHGIGIRSYFDAAFLTERGYSVDEQVFITSSVMSAVRVPQQYGGLSQPLDPLDIARWLANNFVGADNYEYLYYTQEVSE